MFLSINLVLSFINRKPNKDKGETITRVTISLLPLFPETIIGNKNI